MVANGLSPLATQLPFPRYTRRKKVYGVCLHTPGRTIVKRAHKYGVNPLEYVAAHYLERGQYGPTYVVGYNGQIVQVANEWDKTWHVGIGGQDKAAFLDGRWKSRVSKKFLQMWKKRWPISCNPLDLFPGTSANQVYIGVEVVPLVLGYHGYTILSDPDLYTPMAAGLWYTTMQHYALRGLFKDIAERHSFDRKRNPAVFVTHEDLNPLTRSNKSGGWDCGVLRKTPRFDWDLVVNF